MSNAYFQFAGIRPLDPVSLREQFAELGYTPSVDLMSANSWTYKRGRESSVGHLLMRRRDLDTISQDFKWVLEIIQDNEVRRFFKLGVIGSRAVFPRVENQRASELSPYLVTIGDQRHEAQYSHADDQWNYRGADSQIVQSTVEESTVEVIKELWKGLTLPDPKFNVDDGPLESVQAWGVSAWNAIWSILDTVGWSLRMAHNGTPQIFSLKDEPPEVDVSKGIHDASMWHERPDLPEKIVVFTERRDFQWQREPQAHTGLDHHRLKPTYKRTFEMLDLLGLKNKKTGPEALTSESVIPHVRGEDAIWATRPLVIDDQGKAVDESDVRAHMEALARRHAAKLMAWHRSTAWTFKGLQHVDPGSRYGSVIFSQINGEFTTTLEACEVEPYQGRWDVPKPLPGPRLFGKLYGREMFFRVVGKLDSTSPSAGASRDIQPNEVFRAVSLWGQAAGSRVVWNEGHNINVVNSTGRPIKVGRMGFAKWNYQLSRGGMWCAVAVGGSETDKEPEDDDLADWAAQCITNGAEVSSMQDPGLVVVNRRSMLRLLDVRSGGSQSSQAVGVDFQGGPPQTVLATEANTIYWTDSPQVQNMVVNGHVIFSQRATLSAPRYGIGRHRLPNNASRSHQYLIAAAAGEATDWGWHGPGLNCSIDVAAAVDSILDYFCDYASNCAAHGNVWGEDGKPSWAYNRGESYTFENGLLISSSDPNCKPPANARANRDPVSDPVRFNPCEQSSGGSISPGPQPSPGEDPDPIDPDPIPPTTPPGPPPVPGGPDPEPWAPTPDTDRDDPIPFVSDGHEWPRND